MTVKYPPDKYIKYLESELAAKNETVKVYKERYHQMLAENEVLRSDIRQLVRELESEAKL